MMDEREIRRAAEALLDAAPRGSIVILFGSHAAGTARPDSDIDFLVVEPFVADGWGEMARLSALLGERLIPADVVVMSRERFDAWKETPNTLAYRASREGKTYAAVA